MGLLGVCNGLLFAYVPVKLAFDGFEPWVAGAILTALSVGSLTGCLSVGRVVRRVGHARVFATLAAMVTLSVLLIALGTTPILWVISRSLYGLAVTGMFIVSQSWLNDVCDNESRGRAIAVFYMTYVFALGVGGYLLSFVSLDSVEGPLLSIFFVTLAILPVSLTRLRTPPPPENVSIAIRAVWRTAPVGLIGLLTVGGLTMLAQGFAPIYAAAEKYSQDDIALLMFLMQFGMIGVQFPLGVISDHTDRRYVLIAASMIVVVSAGIATQMTGAPFMWLILVFAVWSGATESIYAIANAHTNDRADPRHYVSVSSTLMVVWSASGIVLPGLATILTQVSGPHAFMYVAIATATLYGAFVAYRLTRREPTPEEEQEPYQIVSAQAPHAIELAPHRNDPASDK